MVGVAVVVLDFQPLELQQQVLLLLDFGQLVPDVGVDEIGHVLAVVDFGDDVVLPLLR